MSYGLFDDLFNTLEQIDKEVTILEQHVYKAKQTKPKKLVERRENTEMFTDEERLSMGLYPKDEKYKMSLISKILGKR